MMRNVVKTSDRIDVIRCCDCIYFNDMSDLGKSSYCELHTNHSIDEVNELYFYTQPNGYCAWADRNELKGQIVPDEIEF